LAIWISRETSLERVFEYWLAPRKPLLELPELLVPVLAVPLLLLDELLLEELLDELPDSTETGEKMDDSALLIVLINGSGAAPVQPARPQDLVLAKLAG
jgi:hypothetical protein